MSFIHLPPTSCLLHPLEVWNCDNNSWLVVDEEDNGKFRLKRFYKKTAINNISVIIIQSAHTALILCPSSAQHLRAIHSYQLGFQTGTGT